MANPAAKNFKDSTNRKLWSGRASSLQLMLLTQKFAAAKISVGGGVIGLTEWT